MSALSQFLEEEGIATTGISLVREHSEKVRPPRALWVPFELGRPLGAPGDPAFQHRVIDAALALLLSPSGPVLEDFDEDPPGRPVAGEHWVCPVSFAPAAPPDEDDLPAAVRAELRALAPWYAHALKRQEGRTTVGASGVDIETALETVCGFLDLLPGSLPRVQGEDAGRALKLAVEDLKAYYLEAAGVQPGSSAALNDWLWQETALGRVFYALRETCVNSDDKGVRFVAKAALVPRSQAR